MRRKQGKNWYLRSRALVAEGLLLCTLAGTAHAATTYFYSPSGAMDASGPASAPAKKETLASSDVQQYPFTTRHYTPNKTKLASTPASQKSAPIVTGAVTEPAPPASSPKLASWFKKLLPDNAAPVKDTATAEIKSTAAVSVVKTPQTESAAASVPVPPIENQASATSIAATSSTAPLVPAAAPLAIAQSAPQAKPVATASPFTPPSVAFTIAEEAPAASAENSTFSAQPVPVNNATDTVPVPPMNSSVVAFVKKMSPFTPPTPVPPLPFVGAKVESEEMVASTFERIDPSAKEAKKALADAPVVSPTILASAMPLSPFTPAAPIVNPTPVTEKPVAKTRGAKFAKVTKKNPVIPAPAPSVSAPVVASSEQVKPYIPPAIPVSPFAPAPITPFTPPVPVTPQPFVTARVTTEDRTGSSNIVPVPMNTAENNALGNSPQNLAALSPAAGNAMVMASDTTQPTPLVPLPLPSSAPITSTPIPTASTPMLPAVTPMPVPGSAVTVPAVSIPPSDDTGLSSQSKRIVDKLPPEKPAASVVKPPIEMDHSRRNVVEDEEIKQHEGVGIKISVKRPKADLNQMLEDAYQSLMAGNQSEAIDTYKQVLKIQPTNKLALFGLATTYHRAGQLQLARPLYGQLLAIDPKNKEGLNNFLVLLADESPKEALVELQKLERSRPDFSPIPAQMAIIYEKLGDYNNAVQSMNHAIDLSPENLKYRYDMAIILDRQGAWADAATLYQQLLVANERGEKIPADAEEIQERLTFIRSNRPNS